MGGAGQPAIIPHHARAGPNTAIIHSARMLCCRGKARGWRSHGSFLFLDRGHRRCLAARHPAVVYRGAGGGPGDRRLYRAAAAAGGADPDRDRRPRSGARLWAAARRDPDRAVVERPQKTVAALSRSAFDQRGVVQGRVLATHRIGQRVFEAARPLPLGGRANLSVAADLVDAPIDFEPVIVRVAEFDRELATGAAAALEID